MTDFRQQLLAAFDAEHREHLSAIRQALARARSGAPFDLRDVFRRAHSLKGAARAVDLPVVEELAHHIEALLAGFLETGAALGPEAIDTVHLGLDAIEGFVEATASGLAPPRPEAALQALASFPGAPGNAGTGAVAAVPRATGLPEAESPQAEALEPQQAGALEDAGAPTPADPGPAAETAVDYLRIAAPHVERMSAAAYDLAVELPAQDAVASAMAEIQADLRALARSWGRLQQTLTRLEENRQGRVAPVARDAINAVDRDIASLTRRAMAGVRDQRRAAWSLDQAFRRLRSEIDQMSLVPVETVFGGFGHVVRDLARGAGLNADVRLVGFELEADRGILQTLKDPVLHLLRNAISHGIEPPDERVARGKPPQAEIVLGAASRGGRLLLTVTDDGRGPDLARIEETAIRRGLLPRRTAGRPGPAADRLLDIIFELGFSTMAEVGRLAGRGMGLSVVAEAVQRLHGTVLLRPRQPWGTEIRISVPLTAARQPLLLVEVSGETYAVPTHAVEKLLRLSTASIELVEGRPATRIVIGGRDVMVPVVALASLMDNRQAEIPVEAGFVHAALLRREEQRCAVAVNGLLDVRTLLVGEAGPFGGRRSIQGSVMLDGDVPALVLDPERLVEAAMTSEAAGIPQILTASPEGDRNAAPATILVVDDSITTRTLQKSILEAQGYRVLLSVDGLDALTTLRSGVALVDLVVADIEMPRMDGFALLQAIKADPGLASIPVVLMTSRGDPEDVRRGLDLGAGAYLTKQKFDQRELLATIGQLL